MNQELLTARTKGGQEVVVNYGDYKVLQKEGRKWYVEFKYDEAVALFAGIPASYKDRDIAVEIVEQDKAGQLFLAERERKENAVTELVEAGRIVGFHYVIGCDCGDRVNFVYHDEGDVDFDIILERRERDEKLARAAVSKLNSGCGIEMNITPDLGSYGGWELTEAQTTLLLEAATGDIKKETEAKEKEKAETEAATAAIYQKARETGVDQLLYMYSEPCNRKDYDCDMDNIVTYAMPDGSTTTERAHCH